MLAVCTALGCQAQPAGVSFEPVRFEDGTAVNQEEEGLAALLEADSLRKETVLKGTDTLLVFRHASAFVRLSLGGLPPGGHIDRIDVVPMYGELPDSWTPFPVPEGGIDIPPSGTLTSWSMLPPQSLDALAVLVRGEGFWSARIPGAGLQGGTAYRWTVTCLPPGAPPSGLKATLLNQTAVDIDPGQYSGLAWLGGDRYAVVDDKLPGGGLLHATISIDGSGAVGTMSLRPANGTVEANGKNRDCEGIAFDPASNTLYITSEKHQEIRGYDLAGNPTGAFLQVPGDLKDISGNLGFEALTFNGRTGRFWTTTEAPLRRDTFLPRLLRLQCFDTGGKPAGRYFYQMDPPSRPAGSTVAYVHGVPALAALDDGRLLVLEREVYVPKGNLWDKLRNAFTDIRIYVVDPAGDPAGILRKSRLCSFTTGALNLANFEGMCLGPTLPDGRRCLVLIADSQKGSGGLTQEYLKVILLR